MKRLIFLLVASVFGVAHAELAVNPIYQSHMVLQRGKPVPIDGTCTSSAPIVVKFAGAEVKAVLKGKKWEAVLPPMEADAEGKPLTITQGTSTLQLEDVLVGEVWLATGQSNMLWRLEQTQDAAALNNEEIPQLRFYHSEPMVHTDDSAYTPELRRRLEEGKMYEGGWAVSSPATVRRMSAVGWYFGRELQRVLDTPVGIIHASLGGSEMLAWLPPTALKKHYKDCLGKNWLDSKYIPPWVKGRARANMGGNMEAPHPYKPGYLFSTGIAPWVRFPVAGVIWYQGESDAEIVDNKQNSLLMQNLIRSWRSEFKAPELPVLMVELPRIKDSTALRAGWPEFRAVQRGVAQTLPAVYCATTIDLGTTSTDVHPPRKLEVGTRLADLAAAKVYGKQTPWSGPLIDSAKAQGGHITISYTCAEGLKTTDGASPRGFEVSADGKKFYEAKAQLKGAQVELSCDAVKSPKYARYGWYTFLEPNLVNEDGLPAVPFTTAHRTSR